MANLKKVKHPFISLGLILIGSFAVYGNTLGNDFVWDDYFFITLTDAFRKWENLGSFFTDTPWNFAWGLDHVYYRPMQSILILIISTFFGTNPLGYHLVSLLLYGLVTWLFWRLLNLFSVPRWTANVATLIFLIHPLHTEVVAWATCVPLLFSAVCFLLCLEASTRLRCSNLNRPWLFLILIWTSYTLGILSHDLAFCIPILALAFEFFRPEGSSAAKRKSFLIGEYLGFMILSLALIAIRWYVVYESNPIPYWKRIDPNQVNVLFSGGHLESFLTPINVLSRYALLLLFPAVLSPDPYFQATAIELSALAALGFMVLTTLWVLHTREFRRLTVCSIAWMTLCLLPLSNILPINGVFADRLTFFASMGFSLWLAIVLGSANQCLTQRLEKAGRNLLYFLLAFIICGYTGKTLTQNMIWKNNLVFWLHASIVTPDKPRVRNNLGSSFLMEGYRREAIVEFEEALKLSPHFKTAHENLARAKKELEEKGSRPLPTS